MSDNDPEEELEIVELDTDEIPQQEEPPQEEPAEEPEESDEDEKLVESDDEEEKASNASKNRKRREVQKAARDRAQRELQILREQNQQLMDRVNAIEGSVNTQTATLLDQRFNEAQREVQQATSIIARAVEAGNGEDVVAAMRLKDEAQQRLMQIAAAKQQVSTPQPQGPDIRVQSLAREWADANPWFDPNGRTEESAIALAIDRVLPSEGYDPRSVEYYEELTRRLTRRLGNNAAPQGEQPAKRKAPPQGTASQHAPPSTRKQVFVTPERKQAMIDAGYWDDPSLRNQMLRAYHDYDKNSAS